MNLYGLARGLISVVNPETAATLRVSTGYTQDDVGRQIPSYAVGAPVMAQVQDLSQKDIEHLAAMSIQGSQKTVYLQGEASAISRVKQTGGDLLDLPDGTWLVTAVIESWKDWCRVAVTQQRVG